MSIEVKMPALSPTMEAGALVKWLVSEGDLVKPGDLLAEIETDKATMEFEAVDEGRIARLVVPESDAEIAVGAVIALIGDPDAAAEVVAPAHPPKPAIVETAPPQEPHGRLADKIRVSPLAARIAQAKRLNLDGIKGTGPGGRIVRHDLIPPKADPVPTPAMVATTGTPAPAPPTAIVTQPIADIPHDLVKLSAMRRTIARRLTESKQQIPHIYLTVDVALDPLLALRGELNAALAARGVKLSVNDMLIKALALALIEEPSCNVQFAGDHIAQFHRADISVAVSIPGGLITPVIIDAGSKSLSTIASGMKDLAARARDGKLQPHEYQGGTASLSNLGMFGIKQFEAVINPPQAMILAIGAAERRPVMLGDMVGGATLLSATGSFDHRAIDGADAARLMGAFKRLIEEPISLVG